jgi:hypothetical protein
LVILLGHEAAAYAHTPDDAYISYRFAQNFAAGHGLVFNVGERVEGYTNFLWVVLLGIMIKLGLDPIALSKLGGGLLSVGTLWLTFTLGNRAFGRRSLLSLSAVAFLVFNSGYAEWSVAGLETPLFTFLIMAATSRYLAELERDKGSWASALLFALASLTRPDGVLLFGATGLDRLVHRWGEWPRLVKDSLTALASFLLIFGTHFGWRLAYYGYPFPNTFYAKTGGGLFQLLRGFDYLLDFVTANGGFIFALPLLLLLQPSLNFRVRCFFLLVLVYSCYIVGVGGDFMGRHRFFVPILPLIYLLLQGSLIFLAGRLDDLIRRKLLRPNKPVIGLAFVSLIFFFTIVPPLYRAITAKFGLGRALTTASMPMDAGEIEASGEWTGKWLRAHAPPQATIAVSAAGLVPYYSGLYTIDMLGLTDLHIAHKQMPGLGLGMAGQEKFDFDYILARQPTYIIGPDIPGIPVDPTTGLALTPDMLPERVTASTRTLLERFHRLYEPLQLKLENGQQFYIYRLKPLAPAK